VLRHCQQLVRHTRCWALFWGLACTLSIPGQTVLKPGPLLPLSCQLLALASSLDGTQPAHQPFICPLVLAQAPGSRMAISPFSQVPTQPNFTPRSGARPAGLVAARLGHWHGGGKREPGSCSGRENSGPRHCGGLPKRPPAAPLQAFHPLQVSGSLPLKWACVPAPLMCQANGHTPSKMTKRLYLAFLCQLYNNPKI
jgi:hypothetical protein